MRISEYNAVNLASDDDLLLVSTVDGTKNISFHNLKMALLSDGMVGTAVEENVIYGESFTNEFGIGLVGTLLLGKYDEVISPSKIYERSGSHTFEPHPAIYLEPHTAYGWLEIYYGNDRREKEEISGEPYTIYSAFHIGDVTNSSTGLGPKYAVTYQKDSTIERNNISFNGTFYLLHTGNHYGNITLPMFADCYNLVFKISHDK